MRSVRPGFILLHMAKTSTDPVETARRMIRDFGDHAPDLMDKCAEENARAGNEEAAKHWRSVAAEARRLRMEGEAAQVGFPANPCTAAAVPRRLVPTEAAARKAVDHHIGARLRLRRTIVGMSQQQLAASLGLTFQQIQKYERGANRIGGSTMWSLSRLLGVPVGYFFDELEPPDPKITPLPMRERSILRRKTLEFVRAFMSLPEPTRDALHEFVRAAARVQGRRSSQYHSE